LQPDALIIQDQTLLHQVDLQRPAGARLRPDQLDETDELGSALRAGSKNIECMRFLRRISLKHVAVPCRAALGGFANHRVIALASVVAAIRQKFPASIAESVAAATEAFAIAEAAKETINA
jgi:hypothetical protein